MSELKSCPFCGGEARLVYALDEGTKQITYTVMCMSCSTAIFHPRMSVFEWDAYDTEEEAAAAWNTRHVETCNAELANRYIELPLDADGVPIHIGDMLSSDEYRGRQFPCRGMSVDVRNGKHWTVCIDYDSYSGTSEWCAASRCHHVR